MAQNVRMSGSDFVNELVRSGGATYGLPGLPMVDTRCLEPSPMFFEHFLMIFHEKIDENSMKIHITGVL